MRYVRLALLLFVLTTLLLFWIGDFNTYLGTGDDIELKAVASKTERLVCSLVIGAGFALLCTAIFACFLDRRQE